MFPLKIRLKKKLDFEERELSARIVKVISDELGKLKIDKIAINSTHIQFKNNFFNGQGKTHLMASVDSGFFDYDNTTKILTYQFYTTRMFIVVICMCIFLGLVSWSIKVGIFFLLWLYGMNWIITIIRHKTFFNRLIRQIGQ